MTHGSAHDRDPSHRQPHTTHHYDSRENPPVESIGHASQVILRRTQGYTRASVASALQGSIILYDLPEVDPTRLRISRVSHCDGRIYIITG